MNNDHRPNVLGESLKLAFFTVALPLAFAIGILWAIGDAFKEVIREFSSEAKYICQRTAEVYFEAWGDLFRAIKEPK